MYLHLAMPVTSTRTIRLRGATPVLSRTRLPTFSIVSFLSSMEQEIDRYLPLGRTMMFSSSHLGFSYSMLTQEKEMVKRRLEQEKRRYADRFVDFRFALNGSANAQLDTVVWQKIRIQELQSKKSKYEKNANEIRELGKSFHQCEANDEESKMIGERLNSYFREITGEVMESQVSLSLSTEGFPVRLDDGNKSSGDKKAFASCFGLSLIRLYEYLGCERPRFFVQDAVENMALPTLSRLFNLADGGDAQYIIPILRDRIDALNIPDDRVILELSHREKLFRF